MHLMTLASSDEPVLTQLPLAVLEQQCRTEIAAFQRSRSASPERSRGQYELFRRALVLRDEAAWVVLYTLYEYLVNRWLWTAGGNCSWLTSQECDALVNLVMSKFARAITV